MDSRTRCGFLAVQFEQLVEAKDMRSIGLDTPVGRFLLTRHDNVVSCVCQLGLEMEHALQALRRRGAVEGTFMISHKLSPRDFGIWLDQVLIEDLGAELDVEVELLELLPAA